MFGPGIQPLEAKEVKKLAAQYKLRIDTRWHKGEPYLLLYESFMFKDVLDVLKKKGTYGRFSLADTTNLPTHKDVEKEILLESPGKRPPGPGKKKNDIYVE